MTCIYSPSVYVYFYNIYIRNISYKEPPISFPTIPCTFYFKFQTFRILLAASLILLGLTGLNHSVGGLCRSIKIRSGWGNLTHSKRGSDTGSGPNHGPHLLTDLTHFPPLQCGGYLLAIQPYHIVSWLGSWRLPRNLHSIKPSLEIVILIRILAAPIDMILLGHMIHHIMPINSMFNHAKSVQYDGHEDVRD